MRALFAPSMAALCLAWSLPQAGQAETVAQLLASASERHGELFRVEYMEGQFVFIDGLNEIWRVADDGALEARATAMLDQDILHLLWQEEHGLSVDLSRDLPVRFTGEDFPLAHDLKTITTGQLQSRVQTLPKGLRFDVDGTVFSATGSVFGNWRLEGEQIAVTPSEGTPVVMDHKPLAAAMMEGSPNDG
jgi:hypothetical protein